VIELVGYGSSEGKIQGLPITPASPIGLEDTKRGKKGTSNVDEEEKDSARSDSSVKFGRRAEFPDRRGFFFAGSLGR